MDDRERLDSERQSGTTEQLYKEENIVNGALLEKEMIASKESQSRIDLRGRWSVFIIIWISCLTVFNCALTMFIGFGSFHFEKYEWFITSVTMETFLEIIGMGYIAVHYLFSSGNAR